MLTYDKWEKKYLWVKKTWSEKTWKERIITIISFGIKTYLKKGL